MSELGYFSIRNALQLHNFLWSKHNRSVYIPWFGKVNALFRTRETKIGGTRNKYREGGQKEPQEWKGGSQIQRINVEEYQKQPSQKLALLSVAGKDRFSFSSNGEREIQKGLEARRGGKKA